MAQAIVADARVVYVDNDPIVLAHARALLTSATGPVAYINADARDTGKILTEAASERMPTRQNLRTTAHVSYPGFTGKHFTAGKQKTSRTPFLYIG